MYKLETKGLAKRYGETDALLPTDLQVKAGEFLTLLGPSGSGKTTLLMMIAGLVDPSGGQLLIEGKDATHAAAGQRGIGMVFQSYALFPHMNVWDNVAYGLRMRQVKGAALNSAVEDALAMVKMSDYAKRLPKELSGGQQQRVALARCFAYRPSVVLLDEPLGALDKKLREHMQLEIRRLHDDLGATFIYVTHDQDEALTMSDRVCLMNQARIEQLGTPQELYDRPCSRFAADFIGQSNLLDGRMTATQTFAAGAYNLSVESAYVPENHHNEASTLLVRPEMAELVTPADGFVQGTVAEMVFLGSEIRARVKLDGMADSDELFSVRCHRRHAASLGDKVGIRWDVASTSVLMQ